MLRYIFIGLLFVSVNMYGDGGKVLFLAEDYKLETGNVYDLLELIPMLTVNEDGNISIYGNGEALVMIDNRIVSTDGDYQPVLRQLNLEAVKHVEVMTAAPAKYDAEAVGGIVNIALKDGGMEGTAGNVFVRAGTGDKYLATAGVNYIKGKVNLRVDALAQKHNVLIDKGMYMRQYNNDYTTIIDQTIDNHVDFGRANINASLAYSFTKHHSLELMGKYGQKSILVTSDIVSESNDDDYNYAYTNVRDNGGDTKQLGLNYKNTFSGDGDLKREMTAQFDYTSTGGATLFNSQNSLEDYTVNAFLQSNAQVDYLYEVSAGSNIETGLRAYGRQTEMNFSRDSIPQAFENIPIVEDDFKYKELVWAGYTQWNGTVSKIDFNIGLRAEYTQTEGMQELDANTFDNQYFSLFPSLNLSLPLKDEHTFSFNYGRSIERPNIYQVNPFVDDSNPNNIKYGNPELLATTINSYELKYNSQFNLIDKNENDLTHSYSVSLIYRNRNDAIYKAALASETAEGVIENSFYNIKLNRDYAVEAFYSAYLWHWFKLDLIPSYRYNQQDGSNIDEQIKGDSHVFLFKTNANLTLWEGGQCILSNVYQSGFETPQGKKAGFNKSSITLRHLMLDKKLTLSMLLREPFNQGEYEYHIQQETFDQDKYLNFESPVLEFSIRYSFGDFKIESDKKKSKDSELPL